LEQFNKHAKNHPEIIREYINANGTLPEVVNTLKSIEKSNLTHCSVIFETIHLVLLDLVANTENSTEDVKKTCNNLIRGYEEVIETMLIDATKGCAMQALKLLIALVACDAETYGSKILNFNCLTKEKQLSQMFPTQAFPENGTESIRTHFVNLVLAFIIDGNLVLIKG
jgi:Ribosome 60S biogenesis N-terminal